MFMQDPAGCMHAILPVAPPRQRARMTLVGRSVQTYQAWNAMSLDPVRFGQLPHCHTTAQGSAYRADACGLRH